MRQPIHLNSDHISFDAAMDVARRWLTTLTCAVGAANYFDAWLAGLQLRTALDQGERLVRLMRSESRLFALHRLNDLQSIAAPILALAPTPSRHEIRTRASGPHQGGRTLEHLERQWRRSVQQQLNTVKEEGNGE